jgi:VWFA-related protein
VKDAQGRMGEGLTAKNFTVTENGAPQTIRFFEQQKLATKPLPAASVPEDITVYDRLTRTQIPPEAEGSTRYKDRRLLALVFDMTAMQQEDQLRALRAAKTFIRSQLTADDLVAILRYSGGSVDVLQDFTNDRNRLLSIVETMIVGEGQGFYESGSDASTPDTGAAFGQDDTEFNVFNTDRQLAALQTGAQLLGHLSEKKSIVYFAGGLQLNGRDNQAQLHATINAAIRAGVSFWPIDSRGLVAEATLGDASKAAPGGTGMYSGDAAAANTSNFARSQDTLWALASDTGGKALLDYNDLTQGIVQAALSVSSYYVLGYNTSATAAYGKFRRVQISLNGRSARLDYRQGYFAPKVFAKFTEADKERQLEDALMEENPITDLDDCHGARLLPIEPRRIFCPASGKDSRARAGAG